MPHSWWRVDGDGAPELVAQWLKITVITSLLSGDHKSIMKTRYIIYVVLDKTSPPGRPEQVQAALIEKYLNL